MHDSSQFIGRGRRLEYFTIAGIAPKLSQRWFPA